jgi:hypothetical protein
VTVLSLLLLPLPQPAITAHSAAKVADAPTGIPGDPSLFIVPSCYS